MTRTWLELPPRNDGSRWHKTSLLCDMLLLLLQLVSRDVGNGMWQRNAAKETRKGNERENIAWEMKNVRGKPEEGGKLGRCRTDSHLLFHFRNKQKNACELARGLAASLGAILYELDARAVATFHCLSFNDWQLAIKTKRKKKNEGSETKRNEARRNKAKPEQNKAQR